MGLGPSLLEELILLKRSGEIEGLANVVEIGAQQLSNAFLRASDTLDDLYGLYGKTRPIFPAPIDEGYADGIESLSESSPSSREFWQSLGLSYTAIDFDGHRDSVALDLNRDHVMGNMRGAFDLIINTGTTEHVANQDNAFRTIHDLTRNFGIMYHELPAGGMMNHGLVSYNPKFFWALCRENDYEVLLLKVKSCGSNPVPKDIITSNLQFARGDHHVQVNDVTDFAIIAVLRKKHDVPFVTPLDVPPQIMPTKEST